MHVQMCDVHADVYQLHAHLYTHIHKHTQMHMHTQKMQICIYSNIKTLNGKGFRQVKGTVSLSGKMT